MFSILYRGKVIADGFETAGAAQASLEAMAQGAPGYSIEPDDESGAPEFEVDGARCSLAALLEANADDAPLCEWARGATVGDLFPAFVSCVRVS